MIQLRRTLLPLTLMATILFLWHSIHSFRTPRLYNTHEPPRLSLAVNHQEGHESSQTFLAASSSGTNQPTADVVDENNYLEEQPMKLPSRISELASCPRAPNLYTNHLRLPNALYNISMNPRAGTDDETRIFWNPTIIALPSWAKNQYIVVSMVTPDRDPLRRNVICEANICQSNSNSSQATLRKACSGEEVLSSRFKTTLCCESPPRELIVPATPASACEGKEQIFADIPGFHDPRLFYSARGEPILMISSHVFSSSPKRLGAGPLVSYPTITELTRNPESSRESYEKNWVMFSTSPSTSYIQYELNSTIRTIAKLIGGGLTTSNITSPLEESCLSDPTPEELSSGKYTLMTTWHQATPSLKLILCSRSNLSCHDEPEITVFITVIHRKVFDIFQLPARYERFMVIWSATPPFNVLAVSKHPLLFANETVHGWTAEESWDDVPNVEPENRKHWARFTYTTTIGYVWGSDNGDIRNMGVGYLDDEVLLSVGVEDEGQVYGTVVVSDLLRCLRICPGFL